MYCSLRFLAQLTSTPPSPCGRFYVCLQALIPPRRTGFSREGSISGEVYLANARTASRLKPVLRDSAIYVCEFIRKEALTFNAYPSPVPPPSRMNPLPQGMCLPQLTRRPPLPSGSTPPSPSGRFYVCLQALIPPRRTGFSREGSISGEAYLANARTASRLKPVLRDSAIYVCEFIREEALTFNACAPHVPPPSRMNPLPQGMCLPQLATEPPSPSGSEFIREGDVTSAARVST